MEWPKGKFIFTSKGASLKTSNFPLLFQVVKEPVSSCNFESTTYTDNTNF